MKRVLIIFLVLVAAGPAISQWRYIEIDSAKQKWGDWQDPEWLRYFGLDAGDIDNDGDMDILSGRYVYHNPGNLTSAWQRTVLDDNVDGIFITNVDGDNYADLIAQALPDIYWYEAVDLNATRFTRRKITEIPATSHVNSQGFEKAQIIPGGKEELLIAGNGNVYVIQIPTDAELTWETNLIAANTSDEGIGIGDIDGDGLNDIVCGRRPEGEDEPTLLVWFRNPGNVSSTWQDYLIGNTQHPIDRVKVGDINGDGENEIVITEERYPGLEPDANIFWFSANSDKTAEWSKHNIATQYSTNNLDIHDIDNDGDLDLITAEHKGPNLELQLWENSGTAIFTKSVLDTGKENHLGTKLFDLDNDGDLDIVGSAWDNYKYMHVWQNQRLESSAVSDLPIHAESIPDSVITNYQGRPHYVIKTKNITYYYDIKGGGFSRMIDRQGNDWISFKITSSDYPQGASGMFRGIPNLVFQGDMNGAGHPGFDQCNSWFENGVLYSESTDKKWKWAWTFEDSMAMLEVLNSDDSRNFWFLYEGTPGGKYSPEDYYFGHNAAGPSTALPDFYNEKATFLPLSWAYIGSKNINRVLFMQHLSDSSSMGIISYLGNSKEGIDSKDGMTVFGFGRGPETNSLLSGNHKFIIGFYPATIDSAEDHEAFIKFINNNQK